MSRPESIESLLAGSASEIAPTVTDVSKQTKDGPGAESAETAEPKQTPAKPPKVVDKMPGRNKRTETSHCSPAGQPIRIQISTSDGSEIAAALEEIRSNIPSAFRKNFNLGAFFKEVLQDNDAKIATLIRASAARD